MLAKLGDGFQSDTAELSSLLSGGGRIGWGDSVNRMWMHASLVVLLLVQRIDPNRVRAASRGAVRSLSFLMIVAFGAWVALQWQPDHAPRTVTEREFTVLSVAGDDPIGELVDGSQVRQRVSVPTTALPDDALLKNVCVDVPLVTFARDNQGSVVLGLGAGERSTTRSVDADRLFDWAGERVCLELPGDIPAAAAVIDDLLVTVSGSGAPAGAAPSALVSSGPAFHRGVTFRTVVAADQPVELLLSDLVHDVVLVAEVRVGLLSDPLNRSTLVLPWLALLVGVWAGVGARRFR
jgi:hypothetical protein